MTPDLAFSGLTEHVFVVTKWGQANGRRHAVTKYDITAQFHEIAEQLGYVRFQPYHPDHENWCPRPPDWGGSGACPCQPAKVEPNPIRPPAKRTRDLTTHSPLCKKVTLSEWQPCNCRES